MTIYPGLLENLYNNEIIPCVPYDLYQMTPVSPIGMNQSGLMPAGSIKQSFLGDSGINNMSNANNSNYLDTAMKGQMYGNYGNSYDSFVGSNYRQNGTNQQSMQMYGGGYGGGIGYYSGAGTPYAGNAYGSYGNPYAMNGYGGGGSYAGANNPYSANGYGANPYGNPYSANNYGASPYGNGAAVGMPDNGIYNRYDRRLKTGSGNDFRDAINSQANDARKGVLNSSSLLKGLLAAGIIIATPLLLFKGFGKTAAGTTKTGFWSKLSPKNWFGGKIDWSKLNPKNRLRGKSKINWSKLNPVNWFEGSSKIDWSKLNPKNWFRGKSKINWSKLNPKNWFKKKP